MNTNELFASLRTLFKFSDQKMVEVIKLGGGNISVVEVDSYSKKVTDSSELERKEAVLLAYLNGLIVERRGVLTAPEVAPIVDVKVLTEPEPALTNNRVLTKLKIIFELKTADVLEIFQSVNCEVTKQELSAYSRNPNNKHFRECKDELLKQFIGGLRKRFSSAAAEAEPRES